MLFRSDAAKASVLSSLVSKGTITQAQADAITAAGRGGVRDLVANGTITKDQAKAVGEAMRAARGSDAPGSHLASVLSSLVSKGTITQAQADAITAAKPAHLKDHGGLGHRGGQGAQGSQGSGSSAQ